MKSVALHIGLAGVLVAASACHRAVPLFQTHLAVLGPMITCVTSEVTICAGDEAFQVPSDLAPLATARAVSFGLRHGCLLDAKGKLMCWGDGSDGQLAVAPATLAEHRRGRPCQPAPTAVAGAPALRSLEAGWFHTCGLTAAGEVVCWGDNSLLQLGRAGADPGVAPVVGLGADIRQIAAGGAHTCVLRRDGAVLCWGDGSEGQLGDGLMTDSAQPRMVEGLPAPATSVVAGAYHTCALLRDGRVACWGNNRFGQLGDGTRTRRANPVLVRGLSGPAVRVASGDSFACALLGIGTVQCWGSNELGELGTGLFSTPLAEEGPPSPPVTVEGLGPGIDTVLAAGNHACVVKADGRILCWGANEVGQLGDGSVITRDTPVAWRGRRGILPRPTPVAAAGSLDGIDVSYHSGRVDWSAAATHGHRFALTMATAGDDFRDPFFAGHWERMRQAGLIRGAYHFFVAADDPEAQAHAFLSHVIFEPGDLAPVVDVETLGGEPVADLPERLRTFLDTVERTVGVKPILYTGPTFWRSHMNDQFGAYPLWIAEYDVAAPTVPAGWDRWHLWQWRGNADLPDVASVVDLDRLHPDVPISALLIPSR
jgi:GH25 family lysozyme M1 (1,4-beta-N-acetylmuramidase)/alpha-tubulin suppressor-like RCC1 family protein